MYLQNYHVTTWQRHDLGVPQVSAQVLLAVHAKILDLVQGNGLILARTFVLIHGDLRKSWGYPGCPSRHHVSQC